MLTTQIRYDSRTGLERDMEVCLFMEKQGIRVSILGVWYPFLKPGVQIGGQYFKSPVFSSLVLSQ